MSITVVIECTSSGAIGGYQEQRVYLTDTVGSLIENYCSYKGIRRDTSYALMTRDFLLRESIKTVSEAGVKDGDHLFLVKQGDPSNMGFNHWWVLAAISLTIGIVGLSAITIMYISAVYPPFDYAILFDAGSTHTNMFLYSWQGDKANGTGVVRQLSSCSPEDGSAGDFTISPKGIKSYLEECLEQGISKIPPDRRSNSPVFFAATAGMRIVGLENPEATKQILGNVSELFKSTPLKNMPGEVRVICGEEEALSGWVTVNYLSDTLTQARLKLRKKREVFTPKTIGALDLGGASTQITYEVPKPSSTDIHFTECGNGTKTLKLYGTSYYLYSKSFLCFGVKEMRNMYYVLLLKDVENNTNVVVSSPCENVGLFRLVPQKNLNSHCSNATHLSKFQGATITFNGTGNVTECQRLIESILNPTNCMDTFLSKNCFEKPPPRTYSAAFSAFSSFGFITEGLNYTSSMGPGGFYSKSQAVCNSTWEEILANNYPGILPKYLKNLCFDALYQYILLKKQYDISDEEWRKLNFSQQIDNTDVGWSLGFMINSTNPIPEEEPTNSLLSLAGFILLGVFFISFVALSAVSATIALRKARIVGIRPLQVLRTPDGKETRFTYGAIDA